MLGLSTAKYRITYEAFSKFSGSLSKVDTIDELAEVARKNLKYLFNFEVFRLLLVDGDQCNSFTFCDGQVATELGVRDTLCYEQQILDTVIPMLKDSLYAPFIKYLHTSLPTQMGKLWGWRFDYNNYSICTSVLLSDPAHFSHGDVEILRLLVDSFTTKYKQIALSKQLHMQNEQLLHAVAKIEEKNEQINKINNNQQEIILRRTEEIQAKNVKLKELSMLNAHYLREPLSRILGVIEIAKYYSPEETKHILMPLLSSSAKELDDILKEVVERSEEEIKKLSVD